jgi:hypothetical protein
MLLEGRAVIRAALLLLTAYLVVPGRNMRGNPSAESELAACVAPDGAVVRLYEGNGGATVATWYTVTHDPRGIRPERQVLFRPSYSNLKGIACDQRGVTLNNGDPAGDVLLTTGELQRLRHWPSDARYAEQLRQGLSLALFLAGIVSMRKREMRRRVVAPAP